MKIRLENQVFEEVRLNPRKTTLTEVCSTLYSTDMLIDYPKADFELEVEKFLTNYEATNVEKVSYIRNGVTRLWQFRVVTIDEFTVFEAETN